MNELAARKQLILAQADLHRRLGALEYANLRQRGDSAQSFVKRNRWWLLGGAVVAGAVLARRGGGMASWLSLLASAGRIFLP